MTRSPILIVKTGSTIPSLIPRRGDFETFFAESLGRPLASLDVRDVSRGAELPPSGGTGPVIVTGSPHSVHDRAAWSERTAEWLREAVAAERPILGVCFGHQLLGHALGGRSGLNPQGREVGTTEVELVADDALLEGLADPLTVFETHSDAVLEAPPGARLLARNANTPIQAMAIGDHVRSVQWHPEFDADILRSYALERAGEIDAELGAGTAARVLAEMREAPGGPRLLSNFLEHIAGVTAR